MGSMTVSQVNENIQLSPNFTLAEMCRSQIARENNIKNVPGTKQLAALKHLCTFLLEPLRTYCGSRPVSISSGFRNPTVNALARGSKTSSHMEGEAGDIGIDQFGAPVFVVLKVIASKLPFDQLIVEYADPKGIDVIPGWAHVSLKQTGNRRSVLIINKTCPSGRPFTYKDFLIAKSNAPAQHAGWLESLDRELQHPTYKLNYPATMRA